MYAFLFLAFAWGTVFSQTPVITITPNVLDSFLTIGTNPSTAKSYSVSGTNLIGPIFIGGNRFPGFDFEASLTETPFVPALINLTPVSGIVPPTTIYMRMHSAQFVGNVFDAIDNFSSGAQTKWIGGVGSVLATEPTIPSILSFGAKTNNSIVVNLNGGNGTERILLVKESSAVNAQPYDGHLYYPSSNGVYGVAATQIGNGNYAVYRGTAHTVTVTGLNAGKQYHFAVYEYNTLYGELYPHIPGGNYGTDGTENYLLPGSTGNDSTLNLGNPLPIIINYFKGTKQVSKHLLNWKVTCISSPSVTMVLERSADSRNFTGINSITADAVRCNQPFNYTDTDPLKGMNYYRLKNTDADGKITYSSIVALLNAVKGFEIISIAPNPVVSNNFKLNVASAQTGKMDIVIFDMQGRLVNRQSISLIAGFNSLPLNVVSLATGTYTIRASMANEEPKLMRFVKAGK